MKTLGSGGIVSPSLISAQDGCEWQLLAPTALPLDEGAPLIECWVNPIACLNYVPAGH
jgi:hypothetical protein